MDGLIAFEEHWAIERTLGHFAKANDPDGNWRDVRRRLLDIHDMRLSEMDRHGVEMTILSLNSPAVQGILDVDEAVETARIANDSLAEQVAKRPDRFAGFAALPMQTADAAIEELTRCIRDLGFKGAMVNGFTQKNTPDSAIYYDLPEYRPFWAAIQSLDVPFYIHPRLNIPSRAHAYHGHPWLFSPAWDFAVQTADHTLRLICSGLFDAFPHLQMVLGHLGERIPFDMWRIDHLMRQVPGGIPAEKEIGDYFRSNFHVTTSGQFHESPFRCALAEMGVGRVLFSIDYPFEAFAEAASWLESTELSDADRLKIARTNAIDLFKLDLS